MRAETAVALAGAAMFAAGLAMFYGADMQWVRHAGTFAGIGGIGVWLASALLYLIGRNEPPVRGV